MVNMLRPISIWTVYEHPDDFPDNYVARRFEVLAGEVNATDQVIVTNSLPALQQHLRQYHGELHAVPVLADDDCKVIEVWA